jgi:hypothetical protein
MLVRYVRKFGHVHDLEYVKYSIAKGPKDMNIKRKYKWRGKDIKEIVAIEPKLTLEVVCNFVMQFWYRKTEKGMK